ncbi:hypothetical protein KSS87_015291 [Heliosperma pusillum]|nr:hypothetical protein KSS87_015291 [Heliosperma pusillum]
MKRKRLERERERRESGEMKNDVIIGKIGFYDVYIVTRGIIW